MDQVMALKWVHENIENFGGDPDNVTIWGESAGAGSVSAIPLVEGAQEYFNRIIAQSGAPSFSISTEEAIAHTNEVMDMLGCETVADLQEVDIEDLLAAAAIVMGLRTATEADGIYLPLDPYAEYANGAVKNIDILHGFNKDEMNYFAATMGFEVFKMWADNRKSEKNISLLLYSRIFCSTREVRTWNGAPGDF